MGRAIDSEVAFCFLTEQKVKETGVFSKGVNKGLNIARSAMRNPDAIPTLTLPNEPLCQENKIIIVKCKECKYHKPIDYCEKHNESGWYDDDFCSFGKKK